VLCSGALLAAPAVVRRRQRISQLTYNFNNRIGSGFLEQRDGGLSVFGLSIMKRMEKIGMGVNLSHCGDQTTLDALNAAQRQALFTHATCRALIPGHLRAEGEGRLADRNLAATVSGRPSRQRPR